MVPLEETDNNKDHWVLPNQRPSRNLKLPPSSLVASSLDKLINQLKYNGSSPKDDHKIALVVLLETLEAGLSDNLSAHYFLSAIDPGIGKSLAVSKFLQAWKELSSPQPQVSSSACHAFRK